MHSDSSGKTNGGTITKIPYDGAESISFLAGITLVDLSSYSVTVLDRMFLICHLTSLPVPLT